MNDKTCWLKTLDNIKNIMEPLPFNTWFSQLEFLDIKENTNYSSTTYYSGYYSSYYSGW